MTDDHSATATVPRLLRKLRHLERAQHVDQPTFEHVTGRMGNDLRGVSLIGPGTGSEMASATRSASGCDAHVDVGDSGSVRSQHVNDAGHGTCRGCPEQSET